MFLLVLKDLPKKEKKIRKTSFVYFYLFRTEIATILQFVSLLFVFRWHKTFFHQKKKKKKKKKIKIQPNATNIFERKKKMNQESQI